MKDAMLEGRFSTADAYGKLKEKTTYDIVYEGWRVPFLSMFPNILEATPAPKDKQQPELCD